MSYSFDAKAIQAAIPLLQTAERQTPHWVQFAIDDDAAMFSRMISWMIKAERSPMRDKWQTEREPRTYVIQWKAPSGYWLPGLTYRDDKGMRHLRPPVLDEDGARIGRIRFRAGQ